MKIQCLPRKWFELIKGTVLEEQVLAHNKVVSVQSRTGWDSEPPFSDEGMKSPNLLCLTFDDVTDYSDLLDGEKVARFLPSMARQILRHVGHGAWPVIVHCTAGVSRSGAVASVLDHYWNCVWERKPDDHAYFKRVNPQIYPNQVVESVFAEYIENGDQMER